MKKKLIQLLLLVGMTISAAFSTSKVGAQAASRKIEIISKRFAFDPSEIALKKGQPVTLVLKSEDVPHGLRFRELNLDIKVDKGGTAEVNFTPDKAGDFVGHCTVFCGSGHGSMTLTLHVTE